MSLTAGAVTTVFNDEAALRVALERLEKQDSKVRILEIRSSAPLSEELNGLVATRASRVPLMGIMGGALGGLAAFLIATLTAKAYPLITGHMPIVAAPPVGIITYEGIALGAVLATTLAVIWECRLPRRHSASAADGAVAEGRISLSLEVDEEVPAQAVQELFEGLDAEGLS